MKEINSLNDTLWECKYHIVCMPKYQKKTIYGKIWKELDEVFHRLARQKESQIEERHLMPGLVHMVISIPPKYVVSQMIGYINGKSSIHIVWKSSGRSRNYVGQHFGEGLLDEMKKLYVVISATSSDHKSKAPDFTLGYLLLMTDLSVRLNN